MKTRAEISYVDFVWNSTSATNGDEKFIFGASWSHSNALNLLRILFADTLCLFFAQTEVKKHVMKAALKKGVESGVLIQVKASYKLSPEAKKPVKKRVVKKKAAPKKAAPAKKKVRLCEIDDKEVGSIDRLLTLLFFV